MVIAGTAFRGSKLLLLEVEKVILNRLSSQRKVGYARACLEDPKRPISKDPSYWSIRFDNGSSIFGVPTGMDGNSIRGLRAFCVVLDEAFLLPQRMVESVILPMLNVLADPTKSKDEQEVKSQNIKISTIDYSFRPFYKEFEYFKSIKEAGTKVNYMDNEISADDISLFEFNFEDSYYYTKDGKLITLWGLDWQSIMDKKHSKLTDMSVWLSENKNIAADVSSGYFPLEDIEKCSTIQLRKSDEQLPEVLLSCSAPCILGIDNAPSAANNAFVVIKAGSLDTSKDVNICQTSYNGGVCPLLKKNSCSFRNFNSVIWAYEKNRMKLKDRVKLIYKLMDKFNIISIAIDARGGGLELADLLRDEGYIKSIIGGHAQPLYDPARTPNGYGLSILTLYSTTQNMNLVFNGQLKGLITNHRLLFPAPLRGRPDSSELLEINGHVETLINQLTRIKAIPKGKSISFDIESIDPNTGHAVSGKKDLYSALLYAVARMRELLQEKEEKERVSVVDLPSPVLFHL